jgi:hypothetical protein
MARRGSNSFKRNDGLRALRIAREGGLEPTMMEVVVTSDDGTVTFRVYGEKAGALMPTPTTGDIAVGGRDWEDEIAKLKAKAPKPKAR